MKSLKLLGASVAALALVACESSEEKAAKFAENAQEYLDEGEIARARLQFENALQNDPNNIKALRGAAEVAGEEERYADQLRYLQRLITNRPNDLEALARLARLNLLSGEPEEALRRADQVLAQQPQNIEALTVKGAAQVLQSDLEGASETLETALAEAPDNAEVRNLLAARYVRDEDYNRAREIIDEGLAVNPDNEALLVVKLLLSQRRQDIEAMDDTFAALIETSPQNAFYRERYADFLIARGELDEAQEQLEAALPLLEDRNEAVGRLVGIVRSEEGDDAAEATLRALVTEYEDDDLLFAIPSYLCEIGETERCEEELEALAGAEDRSADVRQRARIQLGERAFSERGFETARDYAAGVLEEDDTNPDALTLLGKVQLAEGEVEPAIETLRQALAAEPDKESALILLGLAYEANDRGAFAEAQLAQAIDRVGLTPNLFQAYRGVLIRNDKTEEAADLTLRFAQTSEASPQIQRESAAVLLSQNRAEEAETVARNLIRADLDDQMARRILATALVQQQRFEEALDEVDTMEGEAAENIATVRIRSEILSQLGRDDELRSYLSSVAEAGEQPEAYSLLAQFEANQGNLDAAAETAAEGVDAFPGRENLYITLYNVHLAQDRAEAAQRVIERGLRNAETTANLRTLKANSLLQANEREAALGILMELREENALSDISANNLAALMLDLSDDPEGALEVARRFEDTQQPFFADTLAWAYYQTGDLRNAGRYSELAVERLPQPNAEILFHRGVIAAANGNTEAARDALEQALAAPGKTDTVDEEAIQGALEGLDQ